MKFLLIAICIISFGCRSQQIVRVDDLPYKDDPHDRQIGDLYLPVGEGPWPVVVMLHGGGWIRRDRSDMQQKAETLAAAGLAVYNVGYRLAPDDQFPAQLEDVYAAQRALFDLAEDYPILPSRSALMGFSAGGHLALLAAARPAEDTPIPLAVVSGAAPTDVSVYPRSPYLIPFIGGTPEEKPEAYAAASPRNFVTEEHPAVFLYHGRWDRVVEVEQSRDHLEILDAAGIATEYYESRIWGHFGMYLFDRRVLRRAIDFLQEHLD